MTTVGQRVLEEMNGRYRPELDAAFERQFCIPLNTEWDFIEMRVVSVRADRKKFTKAQLAFIHGWQACYTTALSSLRHVEGNRTSRERKGNQQ